MSRSASSIVYPFFNVEVDPPYQKFFDMARYGTFPPRFKMQEGYKLIYTCATRTHIDLRRTSVSEVCRFINRCLYLVQNKVDAAEDQNVAVTWTNLTALHMDMLREFVRRHGLRGRHIEDEAIRLYVAMQLGYITPRSVILDGCNIAHIEDVEFDVDEKRFDVEISSVDPIEFNSAISFNNRHATQIARRKASRCVREVKKKLIREDVSV